MTIKRQTCWMAGAGLAAFVLIGTWLQHARSRSAWTDPWPLPDVPELAESAGPGHAAPLRPRTDTPPQRAESDNDVASPDSPAADIPRPPDSPVQAAVRGDRMAVALILDHFGNTDVPLRQRMNDIQLLAQTQNEMSKHALQAIGDAAIYLNRYAVEALGAYRDVEVQRYLTIKLRDSDSLVVSAAVRALARSAGTGAVRELADVIRRNRHRDDGHDDMVCLAVVETLGHIGSPQAVPVLTEELARSEEPGWSMEYGSALLTALRALPGSDSREAILAYADRLSTRIPDDPLARAYVETKIREARAAAENNQRHRRNRWYEESP